VWQSGDPILEKYLPTGNKDRDKNLPGTGGVFNSININLYKYAALNPLKFYDPDGRLDFPVDPNTHRITSPMGTRVDPMNPAGGVVQGHKGTDLRAAIGTPVVAVAGGTVAFSESVGGYGNTVVVGHGQIQSGPNQGKYLSSLTAHLSAPGAPQGTAVAEGQQIGLSGSTGTSTGPHVHFELVVSDQPPARTQAFFNSPRLDPRTANVGDMKWGSGGTIVPKNPPITPRETCGCE
jgi:murein DD-endopeptidase MepM/ murein hydrolase activator NlpD